eukprot:CAMPEP_0197852568 /NCGR_PEP_ID=MMETSP1438-20131217/20945_1 /TAXON_ID=1461541 /ORGANISM="Pterosperma sp., Strain CCMP1384" /LENGTH=384 /DNA_ID=CAMNT_0043466681 /DNA_START=67 /DNA_END=1221 /DNA_ORIENTATION=+
MSRATQVVGTPATLAARSTNSQESQRVSAHKCQPRKVSGRDQVELQRLRAPTAGLNAKSYRATARGRRSAVRPMAALADDFAADVVEAEADQAVFWDKLQCVDFHDPNAPEIFTKSLKETGFAVLVTHPLTPGLVDDVYSEWRDFLTKCAESPELREKYYFDKEKQDGYFPMDVAEKAKGASVKDIKQYYQLYFPDGKYPSDDVSNNARQLYDEMHSLGKTLLQWIDDYMDPEVKKKLPCTLVDSLSYPDTMLRVLHYPAYDDADQPLGAVRAAAHEDINLITVLPSGSSRGLEVFSKEDECWYEVPCRTQSIVVNIGDMLQEMTDGDYVATTHRVVKKEDKIGGPDRMSVPCFMHPYPDVYLSKRYPTSQDFLMERLRELGVI